MHLGDCHLHAIGVVRVPQHTDEVRFVVEQRDNVVSQELLKLLDAASNLAKMFLDRHLRPHQLF